MRLVGILHVFGFDVSVSEGGAKENMQKDNYR